MRRAHPIPFLILAVLLAAAVYLVRSGAGAGQADVRAVPPGHQEIAWMSPATSGDAWERLVAALELLQKDKINDWGGKTLRLNLDQAFLALTADVPEVSIWFADAPEVKLWIRWYKLTGENPSRRWFDKLIERGRPPLAVIGGDTSDRSLSQARALQEVRGQWSGPAPLYCITTATAERYYPRDFQTGDTPSYATWPKLMEVYDKRTFRFCFTNARMVSAVLDFVHQNPQVCAQRLTGPSVFAGIVAQGNLFGGLGMLSATGHFQPYYLSNLTWEDDSYSKDLGEVFLKAFADQAKNGPFVDFYSNSIHYSVGDFLEPNPREAIQVGLFLAENARFRDQPHLLALPTGTQRARRFLRTLCRRAPMEVRNVVVVTGDAVTFNSIYRDRDVAWNILDMPVPLVFFSHRNPVSATAGFGQKDTGGMVNHTGTQDILLNRDLLEALVLAAFELGRPVVDADRLEDRLGHTRWLKGRIRNDLVHTKTAGEVPLFDGAGNRHPGTGEHVIWLKPAFEGNRNLPNATVTVWRTAADDPTKTWRTFSPPLHLSYDRPGPEEGGAHGGN
jgi:hypothetical protein